MAALNFPDPNVSSSFTNTDTGVTYNGANNIWKAVRTAQTAPQLFVDVVGDNMTGDLTLGTDKITLNATSGGAKFSSNVTIDNNRLKIDSRRTSTGHKHIDIVSTEFGDPLVQNGSVFSVLASGSIRSRRALLLGGDQTDSGSNIYLDGTDGSAMFADSITTGDKVTGSTTNSGVTAYSVGALYLSRNGQGTGSDDAFRIYFGNSKTYSIKSDGTTSVRNVQLNLEPDNDANYVTTTDVDEEGNTVETRVYNGPTLDVKERLQTKTAALEAIKTAAEDASITTLADFKAAIATALANI